MFSPKVLDRANTVEFRVTKDDLESFSDRPDGIDSSVISGCGTEYAQAFLDARSTTPAFSSENLAKLKPELHLFFDTLSDCGFEFGYRTVKESADLAYWHQRLCGSGWEFRHAMDAVILQKLLPRIHGSRRRVEPLLCALAALCYMDRKWSSDVVPPGLENASQIADMSERAAELDDNEHPLNASNYLGTGSMDLEGAEYPKSFQKIVRMLRSLANDGFTSFAEA